MSDVTIENIKESVKMEMKININADKMSGDKLESYDELKSIKVENDSNVSKLIQSVEDVVLNECLVKDEQVTAENIPDLVDDEPKNVSPKRAIKTESKISQKLILTKRDLKGEDSDPNIKDESKSSNSSDSEQGSSTETDMRIGDGYQAEIPEFAPYKRIDTVDNSIPMWKPTPKIKENTLEGFIKLAKDKYNYQPEQSLGMLMYHRYDMEKTLQDLMNFSPLADDWCTEDKVIFAQAFSFHGKSFHRIRQMLPDKPHCEIVKFYYTWKKTKNRISAIEKSQKKVAILKKDAKDRYDDDVCTWLEQNEKKMVADHPYIRAAQRKYGTAAAKLHVEYNDKMHHPASKDSRSGRSQPKGMNLDHPELTTILNGPMGTMHAMMQEVDKDYQTLMNSVQDKKQNYENMVRDNDRKVHSKIPKQPKIVAKWSSNDLVLAVEGVREYGKDFAAISRMMGNKTESHLRSFFVNHRRRFNLDKVLQEHEDNKEKTCSEIEKKNKEGRKKRENPADKDVNSKVEDSAGQDCASKSKKQKIVSAEELVDEKE